MIRIIKHNLMTHSVFKRFLFTSLAICIVCLIVAHGVLTLPVSQFVEENRQDSLKEYSAELSRYIGEATGDDINTLCGGNSRLFENSLKTLGNSMHAFILVTDTEGRFVYSNNTSILTGSNRLSEELLKEFSKGEFFEHGTLDNNYKSKYYISASPITAYSRGTVITGYCVVSQSTLWTGDYVPSVFFVFMLVILIAIAVLFILSSVFVYNTSLPLKQMSHAAKRFAVGDFESRVSVRRKDEIGQLAEAFNEMADSLAASEGMRRNFVANVSHELKTPMTTIAGYIDGILDGTIPKEEEAYYLSIVSDEIKRLSRLVTSMISLSKIDSGEIKVNKSLFEIQNTIFNVLVQFEGEIERKNISVLGLENEEDIFTYGDRDLIYQVVYNLVENAVKFTPENGYIKLNIQNSDGETYVSIENSGEGILPEDLHLVFDKFYKADKSRSIDKKSMGLGLYIARTIILLHEGKITAESEPGKYCRFSFRLNNSDVSPKKVKDEAERLKEDNK